MKTILSAMTWTIISNMLSYVRNPNIIIDPLLRANKREKKVVCIRVINIADTENSATIYYEDALMYEILYMNNSIYGKAKWLSVTAFSKSNVVFNLEEAKKLIKEEK